MGRHCLLRSVVYSNGQFLSLEKEGEKRLGRRKMMTKMGKGEKTQRRRKDGKRQRVGGREDHICIQVPAGCRSPSQHPAKSYHSKPQHGIRTYSQLFIAFMETDSMSPFLLQNSNEQPVLLMNTIQEKIKHRQPTLKIFLPCCAVCVPMLNLFCHK